VPALRVFDEKGLCRAALGVYEGVPWLRLFNKDGIPRAGLKVFDELGPMLELYDEKGNPIWSAR